MPFLLVFGLEAVVPMEIEVSTYRVRYFNVEENNRQIYLNLDLLVEKIEFVLKRITTDQQMVARYYNKNMRYDNLLVVIGCCEGWIKE